MAKTHGLSATFTYSSFRAMMKRCYNPKSKDYPWYGGRGIKVCDRWYNNPDKFLDDMGERPPEHSLGRIDHDADYSPSNCQWETLAQQAKNRRPRIDHRKNTVYLTYNGETLSRHEWAKRADLSFAVLKNRLKKGWSLEKILTTPKHQRPWRSLPIDILKK